MDNKIMIVDDAMFMRKCIRRVLEAGGYGEIQEAQDGEEAVRLFQEYKPDLTILDITMPGKSGLEVLEELKALKPDAKVVMCSAIGQESMIQKAILAGAEDFIVKPFKGEILERIVANCLSN